MQLGFTHRHPNLNGLPGPRRKDLGPQSARWRRNRLGPARSADLPSKDRGTAGSVAAQLALAAIGVEVPHHKVGGTLRLLVGHRLLDQDQAIGSNPDLAAAGPPGKRSLLRFPDDPVAVIHDHEVVAGSRHLHEGESAGRRLCPHAWQPVDEVA